MKSFIIIAFLYLSSSAIGQDVLSQEYYEGTMNDNLKISFYLKMVEDGCPTVHAQAIYRYQNSKSKSWILLNSVFSIEKQEYTFVEFGNTGILLLKKEGNTLNGLWISPDGKKQYPVRLEKKILTNTKRIELEEHLDLAHYEAYDC
jgi:hypothetical protein